MYVDDDGEFAWFIFAGALIGGYLGGAAAQDHFEWNPGRWDWNDTGTYFGIIAGGAAGGFAANAIAGPWGLNVAFNGYEIGTIGGNTIGAVGGGAIGGLGGYGASYLAPDGSLLPRNDGLQNAINKLNGETEGTPYTSFEYVAPSSQLTSIYKDGYSLYMYEKSILYWHENLGTHDHYFNYCGNAAEAYSLGWNDCSERTANTLAINNPTYRGLPLEFASSTAHKYLGNSSEYNPYILQIVVWNTGDIGHMGLTKFNRVYEQTSSGYRKNRTIKYISNYLGVQPDFYAIRYPFWIFPW